LASCLALLLKQYPGLGTPVNAWPTMSVELQKAIIRTSGITPREDAPNRAK